MQTLYEVGMIWLICNELAVLALIERRGKLRPIRSRWRA
jgi:hypothetical protein